MLAAVGRIMFDLAISAADQRGGPSRVMRSAAACACPGRAGDELAPAPSDSPKEEPRRARISSMRLPVVREAVVER